MHVAIKVGIGIVGVAALVGTVKLLDNWAAPDEPDPPSTTVPLPDGDAALGVQHLVGRTPREIIELYHRRDDTDHDGLVRYLATPPEGATLKWTGDGRTSIAYREADRSGNDDGSASMDEMRHWIGTTVLRDRPMTVSAAEKFLEVIAYK